MTMTEGLQCFSCGERQQRLLQRVMTISHLIHPGFPHTHFLSGNRLSAGIEWWANACKIGFLCGIQMHFTNFFFLLDINLERPTKLKYHSKYLMYCYVKLYRCSWSPEVEVSWFWRTSNFLKVKGIIFLMKYCNIYHKDKTEAMYAKLDLIMAFILVLVEKIRRLPSWYYWMKTQLIVKVIWLQPLCSDCEYYVSNVPIL